MGDLIPWQKKKKKSQLDWIEGVTPRKKPPPQRVSRDGLAAALAIAALAAVYLLFADYSLLGWP